MELHPEHKRRMTQIIVELKGEEETYGINDRPDMIKEGADSETISKEELEDQKAEQEAKELQLQVIKNQMGEEKYALFQ